MMPRWSRPQSRPRHSAGPRRPRRPKLRTRVLAGVLLVTITALVAFDVSAVTALRRYLLSHTDAQLASVLNLYRPLPGRGSITVPANFHSQVAATRLPPAHFKTIRGLKISGPQVRVNAPILDQFFLEFLRGRHAKRVLVAGNPLLQPRPPVWLAATPGAAHRRATFWVRGRATVTVLSANGHAQLRLQAIPIAGGTLVVTTSLADVDKTVGRLRLILIIGSAVAGLLVALGVALVVRRGLRPIETMATQADRISAGDLTERVGQQDAATEVGRLSIALNDMLGRIETSIRERDASQELTRRFFADASHELRNPLASLRANAELYQQGVLRDRDQVDEAMRRISLEAQRMSGLVDDMLRLARLDQHPEQREDLVDLTALVSGCAERASAADPRRTWRADVQGGLVTVGDEEMLRRAVDNLLANVRAHTPPGTTATITADRTDGAVTVSVCDDGPGVPPDDLPRIFHRFYRGGTHARQPGSGLGLAIVSAIATAHHGTATAALGDAEGLRVTLNLPAEPSAAPTAPGDYALLIEHEQLAPEPAGVA